VWHSKLAGPWFCRIASHGRHKHGRCRQASPSATLTAARLDLKSTHTTHTCTNQSLVFLYSLLLFLLFFSTSTLLPPLPEHIHNSLLT
jgi:hypothetical protein